MSEAFITALIGAVIGGASGALTALLVAHYRETAADSRMQEELKAKYKLASLDKRLQAHQEAYALWWELQHLATPILPANISELKLILDRCREWWVNNNLYLREDVRNSFFVAIAHGSYYVGNIVASEDEYIPSEYVPDPEEARLSFKNHVVKVGPAIAKSIGYIHFDPTTLLGDSVKNF